MKQRTLIAYLQRLGFAVVFLWGALQTACGQDWETPIQLTSEYNHGGMKMVVDSLHRIHMFAVRSRDPRPGYGQPNTLVYYLFDNWGRPLRGAYELLPDTHRVDYVFCGVLLDRLERIHVVWLRHFDDANATQQLIYVRMSLDGQFLQEPMIYEYPGNEPYGVDLGEYHLIETVTGEIWAACADHFFAVDAEGNLIEPVQHIIPPPARGYVNMAAAPDGSVWGTFRKTNDSSGDTLKTIRYWPPPRVEETTLLCDNPGFGPQAFHIDQYGAFHYVIYTEDSGLFYRFDPRGLGQVLSTVFDPAPYGVGESNLLPIGTDSLQYMWGQTLPEVGVNRACFTTDGNLAFGPLLLQPQPQFAMSEHSCYWRDGGYWVLGTSSWDTVHAPVAMLHIPGPGEPLAGAGGPPHQAASPSIQIYPQPSYGTLNIMLPPIQSQSTSLSIHNLLGQQVYETRFEGNQETQQFSLQVPAGLASGVYFVTLSTRVQLMNARFILIR